MRAARAAIVGLGLSIASTAAVAQINKCVGSDGKAMFSDLPCAPNQRAQTLQEKPATPAARSATRSRSGPHGLSFAFARAPATDNRLVHLSCHGEPSSLDRPHGDSCNPYRGDTSCQASLPVACFKATDARPPENLKQDFYSGWVKGQLGATRAVAGSTLTSEQAASALCQAELGAGWRMAEFHDGGGGWGLQGERSAGLRPGTRYWVRINDQRGNCWDSAP